MAVRTYTATFTGAEDTIAVSFAGDFSSAPKLIGGDPVPTDGAVVAITLDSVTSSGCNVNTSGRFSGTVTLIALD